MMLVDSSVWIDYFNGVQNRPADVLDQHLGNALIATGDLILLEVLQGFRDERDFRTAKRLLGTLPVFNLCNVHLAIEAAGNYRYLRSKGVTVRKTVDMVIATFCISQELPLLHNDRHFEPMSKYLGLQVV